MEAISRENQNHTAPCQNSSTPPLLLMWYRAFDMKSSMAFGERKTSRGGTISKSTQSMPAIKSCWMKGTHIFQVIYPSIPGHKKGAKKNMTCTIKLTIKSNIPYILI